MSWKFENWLFAIKNCICYSNHTLKKKGKLENELRNKNYDLVKKEVKIYDVYLEKYKDICYNGDNKNEMLLSMLTDKDNNSLKRIVNSNKEGIVIMDELDRIRKDDKFNAYYDAEKVNEMTRETAYLEGIDKGKLAGEREKQIEIARKLKALSMSDNDISNVTGLSLEELDKTVQKIKMNQVKEHVTSDESWTNEYCTFLTLDDLN